MEIKIVSMEIDPDTNEYIVAADLDEEALKFFTDLGDGDPNVGMNIALKEAIKDEEKEKSSFNK